MGSVQHMIVRSTAMRVARIAAAWGAARQWRLQHFDRHRCDHAGAVHIKDTNTLRAPLFFSSLFSPINTNTALPRHQTPDSHLCQTAHRLFISINLLLSTLPVVAQRTLLPASQGPSHNSPLRPTVSFLEETPSTLSSSTTFYFTPPPPPPTTTRKPNTFSAGNNMDSTKHVIVIGAGISGIAAGKRHSPFL